MKRLKNNNLDLRDNRYLQLESRMKDFLRRSK